ncbi:MAG: 4Fe-4S binding protein [Planctomycetota bacterium]|jgi:polyferredoxin
MIVPKALRWGLALVTVVVLALGYWVPVLGFIVPLAMMVGMGGGLLGGGRRVCGSLCPRGSFFDFLVRPISRRKAPPAYLRGMPRRWALFAVLMAFMVWRASADFGSAEHWGRVFWTMCAVTTAVGVLGAFIYNERFWCTFCPVGTFAGAVSGTKKPVLLDGSACVSCGACDRVCPMHLPVASHREAGRVLEQDCIHCGECVSACSKNALSN